MEKYPKASPQLTAIVAEISKIKAADPIAYIRKALGTPYAPHTFYRRNPLYCGLWIHYVCTVFH